MLFGTLTWVDQRNHVLDEGPDPHTWRGNFEDRKGPAEDMLGRVWRSMYAKQVSQGSSATVQMQTGVY